MDHGHWTVISLGIQHGAALSGHESDSQLVNWILLSFNVVLYGLVRNKEYPHVEHGAQISALYKISLILLSNALKHECDEPAHRIHASMG